MECNEFLDRLGSTKTVTHGKKNVVITATYKRRCCAALRKGVWKHHAPGEPTVASRLFGLDDPSFRTIEGEFMACESVPTVDRLAFELQFDDLSRSN
jgi:hypothetical protein